MRFQGLDLNYLEVLEVLLVERSITQASLRLNRTQPAISNTLAKLRHHFEDELLVRRGREMQLTSFAAQILGPLQTTLRQLRGLAKTRPHFDPSISTRTYKVVASDYVSTVLLSELIIRINQIAPSVTVEQLPINDDSIGKLSRGEVDAFIYPDGGQLLSDYPKRPLFIEHFVCIASKNYSGIGSSMTLEELFRHPRVVPPYKMYWPEKGVDRARTCAPTALPFSSIPRFVARSNHVAVVPERLAAMYEPLLPLRRVELRPGLPPVNFVVQCHPLTLLDPFKVWALAQLEAAGQLCPPVLRSHRSTRRPRGPTLPRPHSN